MRTQHDAGCLWWKDWYNCSCGFLEEEIRNEQIVLYSPFTPVQFMPSNEIFKLVEDADINLEEPLGCDLVIPGTFIMCGEGAGDERQYCSRRCWEKSKST